MPQSAAYLGIPADAVRELFQRFDRLEALLVAGGGAGAPQVQGAGQGEDLPPSKSVRWKLSLPEAMLDAVRAEAKRRQMDPSKLVQEWIWTGLSQP